MVNRYLKIGMRGQDVAQLQKRLHELGYNPGVSDGTFGPKTESAVKAFQRDHQLTVDGVVGPLTWQKLFPQSAAPGEASIEINLGSRRLKFIRGGFSKTYPAAIGKALTPSPKGTWQIKNKSVNPGGPFGSRWMGLNVHYGSYGIHGTNNPASIGQAVSNGCIRMFNRDIEEIFPLTPVGTTVKIY